MPEPVPATRVCFTVWSLYRALAFTGSIGSGFGKVGVVGLFVSLPTPEAVTSERVPGNGVMVVVTLPLPLMTGVVGEAAPRARRIPSLPGCAKIGDIMPSSSCSRMWQCQTNLPGKFCTRSRRVILP